MPLQIIGRTGRLAQAALRRTSRGMCDEPPLVRPRLEPDAAEIKTAAVDREITIITSELPPQFAGGGSSAAIIGSF
jgi:hypothetical protein